MKKSYIISLAMDPITALLATILTNITMGMSEKKEKPRKEVPKATTSEDDQIGCVFFLMLFMLLAVILALSYFIITLTDAKGPLAQLSVIFVCFSYVSSLSLYICIRSSLVRTRMLPNNQTILIRK